MAPSAGELTTLRPKRPFPSAQLQASVEQVLASACDPPSSPQELLALLRLLVSQLGRVR